MGETTYVYRVKSWTKTSLIAAKSAAEAALKFEQLHVVKEKDKDAYTVLSLEKLGELR